jgi:hypothetical protein
LNAELAIRNNIVATTDHGLTEFRTSVMLEDVQIIFRNFAGAVGLYNKEGVRSFAVVLSDYQAEYLLAQGWNVKIKPPKEVGDGNFNYISVAVDFDGKRLPNVVMRTSKNRTRLNALTSQMLDYADILVSDVVLRPYDWDVNGNTGRKAYLKSIVVLIDEDPLEIKYEHLPYTNPVPELTADGAFIEGEIVDDSGWEPIDFEPAKKLEK